MPNPTPNPNPPSGTGLEHVAATETVHHEQSSRKHPRGGGVSQLNLTSMMDVCFQLLIFFIVTASFAVGEGILPAELPAGQGKKSSETEPPEQPVTILLRSLGGQDVAVEILGNSTPLGKNFNELYAVLWQLQNRSDNPNGPYTPEDPIIIKPDGSVAWGHVVNAFNAAIRAKYTNVNFAQPQK